MKLTFAFLLLPFIALSQSSKGYFNYTWIDSSGQLLLEIPEDRLGEEFLYVNSLTAGVGSNDIGLDRGQLGDQRVVSFYRSGKQILMIEKNLKYRADSDNAREILAIEEAFAQSVVHGFKVTKKKGSNFLVDMKDFLIRDAHGVAKRLKDKKQGVYSLDKKKSVIYPEGTMNFPENTEFEALISFTGSAQGEWIKSVTPSPDLVSVRMHHSFIKLPDNDYQPRLFHPESGFGYVNYFDYANPIGEDMQKRYIRRHHLVKKTVGSAPSEAVEPIIYYIDPGCPEPVKTALMEGASWWNQAYEAAGFINAFQVKELPDGAHPMDVRYNMIQWVHRSTRGWSYGASITDPRTGEILKGHVSLGSLRVRQDYLIAQGLLSNFSEDQEDERILAMALDRLRQLSAHEVGHTIGLAHNFAASVNDRSSVMDYPHPLLLAKSGDVDFSMAYDQAIGSWDKRSITYGYADLSESRNEVQALKDFIAANKKDGFQFITDQDARPAGGLHPYAHLWDNGNTPIDELKRITELRKVTLANFNEGAIKDDLPYSELEKVLVPVYLMHRYQVDAGSKILGGYQFDYSMKGQDDGPGIKPIPLNQQKEGLKALLKTLDGDFLIIPETISSLIPPPAFGYPRTRETFKGEMGSLFDPLSAAEASANHTLKYLLNPERLARIDHQSEGDWSLNSYLESIEKQAKKVMNNNETYGCMLEKLYYIHLMMLAKNTAISKEVSAMSYYRMGKLQAGNAGSPRVKAHYDYLNNLIGKFKANPEDVELPGIIAMPPGSPIGCH